MIAGIAQAGSVHQPGPGCRPDPAGSRRCRPAGLSSHSASATTTQLCRHRQEVDAAEQPAPAELLLSSTAIAVAPMRHQRRVADRAVNAVLRGAWELRVVSTVIVVVEADEDRRAEQVPFGIGSASDASIRNSQVRSAEGARAERNKGNQPGLLPATIADHGNHPESTRRSARRERTRRASLRRGRRRNGVESTRQAAPRSPALVVPGLEHERAPRRDASRDPRELRLEPRRPVRPGGGALAEQHDHLGIEELHHARHRSGEGTAGVREDEFRLIVARVCGSAKLVDALVGGQHAEIAPGPLNRAGRRPSPGSRGCRRCRGRRPPPPAHGRSLRHRRHRLA